MPDDIELRRTALTLAIDARTRAGYTVGLRGAEHPSLAEQIVGDAQAFEQYLRGREVGDA